MNHVRVVIAVVILGVVSLAGIAILAPMTTIAIDMGVSSGSQTLEDPVAGDVETLDRAIAEEPPTLSVRATRENAIRLDGGGYVTLGDVDGWAAGDWSVCSAASLDSGTSQQGTYSLFASDNRSVALEYANESWRAYHDTGGDTAVAEIDASSPTQLGGVCAAWNSSASELLISDGDSTSTASPTADEPTRRVANNWHGTIDETRIIDATVTESAISTYADDPIYPLSEYGHEARLMFDEGAGETSHVYYHDSEVNVSTATWTGGVANPTLQEGADYGAGYDPLRFEALSGGYLDGAPVVYLEWDSGLGGPLASIIDGTSGAMEFIPVIMLVMLAGSVIAVVQRMR